MGMEQGNGFYTLYIFFLHLCVLVVNHRQQKILCQACCGSCIFALVGCKSALDPFQAVVLLSNRNTIELLFCDVYRATSSNDNFFSILMQKSRPNGILIKCFPRLCCRIALRHTNLRSLRLSLGPVLFQLTGTETKIAKKLKKNLIKLKLKNNN